MTNNVEKLRNLIGDKTYALCIAILLAAIVVSFTVILAGALLAATYLWQWPGFILAAGAILTTILGVYLAATND